MNTSIQTDTWISRIVIALVLILVASVAGILILMVMGHPLPELLVALGLVATGGLIRVLVSPLTPKFME